MRYKYKIEITYINPETSESKEIQVQNIKSLFIDRNYEKCNMPVGVLTLTLNKALVDDMILNINKNRLNISLYKMNIDGDETLEKVFSEQFTYSTDQDINYHNELDYNETDTDSNGGKKREDVFMTVRFGIMCKKNLDNKAHYVNKIVNNCSVEECIIQEFQGMDIVMEPFESSAKKTNIIITPTETYQKLLEKLNKIDGFYSTPFRFFMDYDTAYLLSSSGKATKAKNEKYSDVSFDIRSVASTSSDPYSPGLDIDDKNKCYSIPISADNTDYKMNHITSKYQNDIKAIIDVSKEVKDKNASAKSLMNKLNIQKNKINQVVNSNISKIASVGNDLNTIGRGIEDDVKTANKVATKITNILGIVNSDIGPWKNHTCKIGSFNSIGEALTYINTTQSNTTSLVNLVSTVPSEFNNMKTKLFSTAHKSMNFGSFLNCVTEIHYNDNINGAQDLCTQVINGATENIQTVNNSNYNKAAKMYSTLSNKLGKDLSLIRDIPDKFYMRQDGTEPTAEDPPESLIEVDLTESKENIITLITEQDTSIGSDLQSALNTCATTFSNNVQTMITTQNTSQGIANGCSGSITNIMNTKNNLADEFNGGAISLYNTTVSKASDAKTNISNAITLNKDSISSYSNNILESVQDNINSLGSLNDIGSLGMAELDTNVSIDGKDLLKDETKKTVAMRVPNDNVNLLKQEAAKIKLTASVLTLNKYDLDTQVFTPNKSYTVKNYDTHSDRDGKFILSVKKESYNREDDVFRLTSILTFRKAD